MSELDFHNQVVLITNASQAPGPAIAHLFGEAGALVVLADIELQGLNALTREMQDAGYSVVKDLLNPCDPTSSHRLAHRVVRRWNCLNVWINNLPFGNPTPNEDLSAAQLSMVFDQVVSCAYACAQAAHELMCENGGVIVNIGSISGLRVSEDHIADNVAHAALIKLTEALGVAWVKDGVRVVGIAAGELNLQRQQNQRKAPSQKLLNDADIAQAALFLASPAASYITAETLTVDGGWSVYQLF